MVVREPKSLSDTNCFHLPGEVRAPGFLSEVRQLGGPSQAQGKGVFLPLQPCTPDRSWQRGSLRPRVVPPKSLRQFPNQAFEGKYLP